MTSETKQEKQWIYAKALEIAALMQGPYPGSGRGPEIVSYYSSLIHTIVDNIRIAGEPGTIL
jgi:hypothetical protein